MKKILMLVALLLCIGCAAAAYGTEGKKDTLLNDFKSAAKDNLGDKDLARLSTAISHMYSKYKFSDDDIGSLSDSSINLVLALSEFSDQLESSDGAPPIPRMEVKGFCTSLEGFLKKYKVSAEDTLNLGKAVTAVAMSKQEVPADKTASKAPTKEDMDKVFGRLTEFSVAHNIQAADLMPLIYQLSDIGLTVLQNQAIQKRSPESGTNKSSRRLGVSTEQVKSLVSSLLTFGKKYNIQLGELVDLGNDITKILKK